MQLTIDSVAPSKSGKALRIKAGNEWYGANKDSGLKPGMTIEGVIVDNGYGPWIKEFRNSVPAAKPAQAALPAQQAQASGTAPFWLPMASNTVAHAIQSGLIREPGDIKVWAAAVRQALVEIGDVPV